jgi:hypothetical protein
MLSILLAIFIQILIGSSIVGGPPGAAIVGGPPGTATAQTSIVGGPPG